jgi:hypothetical protein
MKESLKDKLTMLAYLTEKDYKTTWDDSAMTIRDVNSGIDVTSGSEEHCEKCVEILLLMFSIASEMRE